MLLDILLPRVDGWDLLAQLKADPATAACPVVIVSMLDERGKGFALGASEYLVKPVGREEMVEALARCAPPGERTAVLVIDDDAVDRRLLAATLEPAGYQVLTAAGGSRGSGGDPARAPGRRPARPADARRRRLRSGRGSARGPGDRRRADRGADREGHAPADRERLAGRISYLAQKGAFGRDELVELIGRLSRMEELL